MSARSKMGNYNSADMPPSWKKLVLNKSLSIQAQLSIDAKNSLLGLALLPLGVANVEKVRN